MNIFGPSELQAEVFDKNLCIGCGACIGLCPYFESYRGKTAFLFPCTLEQGRCFAFCPKIEVDLEELAQASFGQSYTGSPLGTHQSIKISKAGAKAGSGAFQAGGTVSALMSFALEKGYIDAAVCTDKEGILPVPRLVTEPEGIYECASSKYTAAPTLSALNQAIKDGYKNLGVIGVPCQMTAVASLRTNPTNLDAFEDPIGLAVGLFCTWSLDYKSFHAFVSKLVSPEKITKVDIPPPPAEIMEIFTGSEKIEIPLDEIRALVPETCSYCPDMTAEFSDISVGVLEGRPDMNTLIIRTERGRKIVEDAQQQGYLVTDDIRPENLEHLTWAAGNKKKRALIKSKEEGLVNVTEEGRKSLFRIRTEVLEEIIQDKAGR